MAPWLVFVIATITWLIWVPVAAAGNAASGSRSGVSVFPILPVFPLVAWGGAALFHFIAHPIGATVIGMAHTALLVALLVSLARSRCATRGRGQAERQSK